MREFVLDDSLMFNPKRNFPPKSRNVVPHWDFSDEALNSSRQQINRQKSALNQEMVFLDAEQKLAGFEDRHDGLNTTTLESCTCNDFNLAGNYPRKKFAPCKHIYALAFELGLIVPTHFDHRMREKMEPKLSWEERLQLLIKTLQAIPRDETKWGSWSTVVHSNSYQVRRQLRAFEIIHDRPEYGVDAEKGIFGDYQTTLTECTCMDFDDRKLPCKHIYCLAILKRYPVPATLQDYIAMKSDCIENAATAVEGRTSL